MDANETKENVGNETHVTMENVGVMKLANQEGLTMRELVEWVQSLPPEALDADLSFDCFCATVRMVQFKGNLFSFENDVFE